jgi:hypothetical protein
MGRKRKGGGGGMEGKVRDTVKMVEDTVKNAENIKTPEKVR